MAEPARSKIRYDDFIANINPDPAKPEPTLLLSGFVGHGDGEGTVRIFPEPSLGTWYDVPEADIVHTLPIPDSPLGGSHVWVKTSAQIQPGSAAAPAPAAAPAGQLQHTLPLCTQGFPTFCGCTPGIDCMAPPPGGLQSQAPVCTQGLATFCGCTPGFDCMAPAAQPTPSAVTLCCMQAQAGFGQPTPQTRCFVCDDPAARAVQAMPVNPTPQTHCFVCDPAALHQATPAALPTPATRCFFCPPLGGGFTPATVCTHPGCQPGLQQAAFQPTPSAVTLCCMAAAPQAMQGVTGLGPCQATVGGAAITQCCPTHGGCSTHFCMPQGGGW
jgi:hypothetical protein